MSEKGRMTTLHNGVLWVREEDCQRECAELAAWLRRMTANFRTSLLLVDNPDTRALGMTICREADALAAKHTPKAPA